MDRLLWDVTSAVVACFSATLPPHAPPAPFASALQRFWLSRDGTLLLHALDIALAATPDAALPVAPNAAAALTLVVRALL